jgi:hypothetical protein
MSQVGSESVTGKEEAMQPFLSVAVSLELGRKDSYLQG